MGTITIRPKSHTDWLNERKSGIGSSEVATIVGLNPYQTPYQLWRVKLGVDAPTTENFAMRAGHYLEDAVAQFWHDETQRDIIKNSATDWLVRDSERPFLQASPDRTYWLPNMSRSNENKGILECKTTQTTVDPDDLPKHWFCQVQYQLGIAGYTHGSLAWLSCGREFGYKDIDLVPEFYAWLTDEVEKFWRDNVLNRQEPAPINVKDILLKYNKHIDGKTIEVTDEIFNACGQLKDVKQQIKALETRQAELEETIKMVFGDAEGITHDGTLLATWKAPKASPKFDAKALQADAPSVYEKYLVPTQPTRRFLLK